MQGNNYTNYNEPNFMGTTAGPGLVDGAGVTLVDVRRGVVNDLNVERAQFTGHGPVDQLDQKLADRNLIDNNVTTKGPLYGIGGFPAVESYRQDPADVMKHKFTGQTHFDSETPFTGPGFTNGDLYDKPGFAGTKAGQSEAQGPIKALAQKIVGQHYTTHEPMMDKIYVEPHQKGPIDTLAHMIVGKGGSHPTQTDLTGAGFNQDTVVKQSLFHKVKDVFHHKSDATDLVNKEKAEGPIDALVHKLTGTLHDPVAHKGGVGAQHDGVLGGANTIPVTEGFVDNTGASAHQGLIGKVMDKLHLHKHTQPSVADKGFVESNQFGAR